MPWVTKKKPEKSPPIHGPHVKMLTVSYGVTQPGLSLQVPPARRHLYSILC